MDIAGFLVWRKKNQEQDKVNDFKNKLIYLYIALIFIICSICLGFIEFFYIYDKKNMAEAMLDSFSSCADITFITMLMMKNKYSLIFDILAYILTIVLFIIKIDEDSDLTSILLLCMECFNYVLCLSLSSIDARQ
jgi:nicotinamide riboside transporter PnuC